MAYAAETDPLCYPNTSVLINRLGLTDPHRLEEAEVAFFFLRAEDLPDGDFGVRHYRLVHRHLFQDVYSWAGELRTIRIGKGHNWFCYPEHIEMQLTRVFSDRGRSDELAALDRDLFIARMAHFLAELNAVHPFREGNGRTQLTFTAMLAKQVGYELDATRLDAETVMRAMIMSFSGSEDLLIELLDQTIR